MVRKEEVAARRAKIAAEQAERDEDALDPVNFAVDDLVGRRDWQRSKFDFFTGIGTLKDGAGYLGRSGQESAQRVQSLSRAAFGKTPGGRAISPEIVGGRERFLESMRVNTRSIGDIRRSVRNTYAQFWTYGAFIIVTILWAGVWTIIWGAAIPSFPQFDIIIKLFPAPLLAALLLRAGYTNWLFRRRSLDELPDYIKSRDWLPSREFETNQTAEDM